MFSWTVSLPRVQCSWGGQHREAGRLWRRVLAGAGTCARHARCQHYAPRATQHRERGAELVRAVGAQFWSLGRGEQWHWPVVTVTSSVPGASQVSPASCMWSHGDIDTWYLPYIPIFLTGFPCNCERGGGFGEINSLFLISISEMVHPYDIPTHIQYLASF